MTHLQFQDASLSLSGRSIISQVSLELRAGDFVALIGPNGSGKTSLTKLGLGLLRPSAGQVLLDAEPAHRLAPRDRAKRVAWLPQRWEPSEQLPVVELVVAARYHLGESYAAAREHALVALERVGAAELAERRSSELSGGELQRALLAGVVAQGAPLLMLDEPANHLDPRYQIATYCLLGELWRAGASVLCVTHDVNLLAHVGGSPRIVGLKAGALVLDSDFRAAGLAGSLSELFDVNYQELGSGDARTFIARSLTDVSPGNVAEQPGGK